MDEHDETQASTRWAWFALGGFAVAAAALFDHLGRGRTFFFDEWTFVLDRRGHHLATYLEPHNGHLSAIPVAAYQVMMAAFGAHHRPYRWVDIAVHLIGVALLHLLLRRRVSAPIALAASVVYLFLGSAWQNLLWPFQIGFLGSIAFGLGALALSERPASVARDVGVGSLLLLALACSGLGVPLVVGTAVLLAMRGRRLADALVIAAPTAVYGIWYVLYGESQANPANLPIVPNYVLASAGGAVAGLAGIGQQLGTFLAGAIAALLAVDGLRRRRLPARTGAALATAGAFWVLTALSRGALGEPTASRYLTLGGLCVLLVLAELVAAATRRTMVGGLVVAIALVAVWSNLRVLRAGAAGLRETSEVTRAELAAMELLEPGLPADFQPDGSRMPQVHAGAYARAVAEIGSPAASLAEVGRSSKAAREAADRVIEAGLPLVKAPAVHSTEPLHAEPTGATASMEGTCVVLRPTADQPDAASAVMPMPRGGVRIESEAPVHYRVRRFADDFGAQPASVLVSGSRLSLPPRASDGRSLVLQLSLQAPARVCPA
jgi:hypothetical protein